METDNLDPIDILVFTTQELQERFREKQNQADRMFEDFLCRWEADTKIESVKNMQVEFAKDLEWFNVTQPLTIEGLRGKIVVLDFFTYCCINCMHVLPDLRALEELFPAERGLVVIGVHSPKFENERDAAKVLAAAQRYDIQHPIVNDPRSQLWRSVGIHCWPSLLVLSPSGKPMLLLMGEGHGHFLERFVERALRYFQQKGDIQTFALPLRPSKDLLPASNLRFPAKIARSATGAYAVADAGNHRILVVNAAGLVTHKVGGNVAGFVDGDFGTARFNYPQGLDFLDEDTVIVADTENHALRQIKLSANRVETLAGNGQQGTDRVGGKTGPLQYLSSPWDVAVFRTRDMDMSFHRDEKSVPEKPVVLISMAGTHQIWGYFPEGVIFWKFRKYEPLTCVSLIGTGHEENRNNTYPHNAAFAQPSGLAMAKNMLFIADSESSSIRKAGMLDGHVMPVVGGDRNPLNLFAFGDVDGKLFNAKLQHPMAVAYNHVDEKVYVADTYNHKVKVIDVVTSTLKTLPIKDASGKLLRFNEPAGLCVDANGQQLFVADTNNHEIMLVNLQTLVAERVPLDFSQAEGVVETDSAVSSASALLTRDILLRRCKTFKLNLALNLSAGLKFTPEAPQKWTLKVSNSTLLPTSLKGRFNDNGTATLQLQRAAANDLPTLSSEREEVRIDMTLSLCDDKCCLMRRFALLLCDSGVPGAVRTTPLVENVGILVTPTEIQIR